MQAGAMDCLPPFSRPYCVHRGAAPCRSRLGRRWGSGGGGRSHTSSSTRVSARRHLVGGLTGGRAQGLRPRMPLTGAPRSAQASAVAGPFVSRRACEQGCVARAWPLERAPHMQSDRGRSRCWIRSGRARVSAPRPFPPPPARRAVQRPPRRQQRRRRRCCLLSSAGLRQRRGL
jgi:hypothetical protein